MAAGKLTADNRRRSGPVVMRRRSTKKDEHCSVVVAGAVILEMVTDGRAGTFPRVSASKRGSGTDSRRFPGNYCPRGITRGLSMKSLASSVGGAGAANRSLDCIRRYRPPRRFKVRTPLRWRNSPNPASCLRTNATLHADRTRPDRAKCHRGNVGCLTRTRFDERSVIPSQALEPTVLVRMSASSTAGPSSSHDVESGSDHYCFWAQWKRERQLYRVNLLDHQATALSLPTQDVSTTRSPYPHRVPCGSGRSTREGVVVERSVGARYSSAGPAPSGRPSFPITGGNTAYMPTEFGVWQTGDTPAPTIDAIRPSRCNCREL